MKWLLLWFEKGAFILTRPWKNNIYTKKAIYFTHNFLLASAIITDICVRIRILFLEALAIQSYFCVLGIIICGHELKVIIGPQIQHSDLDLGWSGKGRMRTARLKAFFKHK